MELFIIGCFGVNFWDEGETKGLLEREIRPRFACRCSRERVVRALATLDRDELRDMAARDGGARASCDFCGESYGISAAELLELAAEDPARN